MSLLFYILYFLYLKKVDTKINCVSCVSPELLQTCTKLA